MHLAAARARAALLLVPLLALPACTGTGSVEEQLRGERLEVLASWSGAEAQRMGDVLAEFERRTGTSVSYASARHRMADELGARLAQGRAPDVAFLPQPGLLRELAAAGHLVPLDDAAVELVDAAFAPTFRSLASHDGELYGVWFKAANKSLVWYDVATFERLGAVPPSDLDGLLALARRTTAAGTPAFAVSARDGWTLTDWFENLYIRLAGLEAYDALAERRLSWTDPTVAWTLRLLDALLSEEHLAGGSAGALTTDFEQSVQLVFDAPAQAAMVVEGDFVAGVVRAGTGAELQVDADVFPFPTGPDGSSVVVGGGDVAVQLRPSRAGAALLRFLATPEAAAVWARAGGFVSPNLQLDLAVYPDDVSRVVARRLLEAGDGFRFDLSDLQPAAFGGTEDGGLRAGLRAFLEHRDVERAGRELESAARAAYGEAP
jgi:alpha-glucoside transport system substrate-binding protein